MRTYSEFRPTGFDCRGLGLEDRQDWLVAPVGTNRDADRLTRSNWAVVTEDIASHDPEGTDHELHSFGHWACGHFDICLVRPGSKAAECAEGWESALADYPVASDDHHSELEWSEMAEYWEGMSLRERVRVLSECDANIMAARRDSVPDNQRVWDYLTREG